MYIVVKQNGEVSYSYVDRLMPADLHAAVLIIKSDVNVKASQLTVGKNALSANARQYNSMLSWLYGGDEHNKRSAEILPTDDREMVRVLLTSLLPGDYVLRAEGKGSTIQEAFGEAHERLVSWVR